MVSLKQKMKRLHRKNSQTHAFILSMTLVAFLGISVVARFYVIVPLRMMDASMSPGFKERDVVWMCKLPLCLERISEGDVVWANLRGNEEMVRQVLAMPGDTVSVSDKGQVVTPHRKYLWKKEEAFIQSRQFYIPKTGDTLDFQKLNDVEQDYVISYLREKGEHVIVKTTLWQGDREINIDRVGSTKIANRQVSLNEIDYLPWQDRFLIEMQIRQSEPGNFPITLKREIFRGIKKLAPAAPKLDSTNTTLDSSASVSDSLKDSTAKEVPVDVEEIITEPIRKIVIQDDCYYLVCSKGNSCPDSREIGYVTKDKLIGRYIEWPTRIDRAIVTPAIRYISTAFNVISDICSDIYSQIEALFESSPEETKESSSENTKKN